MRQEQLQALEAAGLTRKEGQAYVALLSHGVLSARDLSVEINDTYPSIYRTLYSLITKGWVETTSDRPRKFRARDPRVVASEVRTRLQDRMEGLAGELSALGKEARQRGGVGESHIWIYKGWDPSLKKMRELAGRSGGRVFGVSPHPLDRRILASLFQVLGHAGRRGELFFHRANERDLRALDAAVPKGIRALAPIRASYVSPTRVSHTFLFFGQEALFILNTFYRENALVEEKTHGLLIDDVDVVHTQLEGLSLQALRREPRH